MHAVRRPTALTPLIAAGLLAGGLLAACGTSSSTTTSTAHGDTTTSTSSTATSTGGSSAGGASTTTTGAGPRNLAATLATKAALQSAFVAYKKVPASDIAGTQAGSVYYAYVPSTQTYWALASFTPSSTASQDTLVGMQDGGATGIFRRGTGGSWTMLTVGSFPFCPSQTPLPSDVRTLWGLSDPTGCSPQG